MNFRPLRTALGLAALSVFALACQASDPSEDPATADAEQALEAQDEAPQAGPHHHGPHHGPPHAGRHGPPRGPHVLFGVALHELELSDAQRASIEQLVEGLRPERPPKEHETKRAELVAAVRAGSVDPAAFAPPTDGGPHAEMHARFVAALDSLHDTLDAEQRAQLVAVIEERHAERAERRDRHAGKRKGMNPARMLLRGIDVTDEQQSQIEQALADAGLDGPPADRKARMAEMKAKHEALLDAFASDGFDAESALPPPPNKGEHVQRFIKTVATVVPLLDDAQRDALAQRIERGPRHHKRGPRGHRGPGPR